MGNGCVTQSFAIVDYHGHHYRNLWSRFSPESIRILVFLMAIKARYIICHVNLPSSTETEPNAPGSTELACAISELRCSLRRNQAFEQLYAFIMRVTIGKGEERIGEDNRACHRDLLHLANILRTSFPTKSSSSNSHPAKHTIFHCGTGQGNAFVFATKR